MTFKRFVNGVEVVALVAAAVLVIFLFANEPGGDGGGGGDTASSPGAEIYSSSCAGCHGADGDGGIGPQLADGAVVDAFPDVEDELALVADGRSGMPAFGDDLSAEELRQVVEYTRTDLGS